MSKKTYVITVSEYFQKDHPMAGDPTGFVDKILSIFKPSVPSEKIHTLRDNYEYWEMVVNEVNSDRAVLSLRTWTGKPYNSPQKEFLSLERCGIQKITIAESDPNATIHGSNNRIPVHEIAKGDGLDFYDFMFWFFPEKGKIFKKTVACIHFTDFRY